MIENQIKGQITKGTENTVIKSVPHNQGIVDVDQAVEHWKTYQKLTNHLLDESDYQKIGDRKFKKKSAWRKYM
jgi:hypothetical protein